MIIVVFILVAIELAYFRIARKFRIVDRPNHRSSHTKATIRGGGIIFLIAVFCYAFLTGLTSVWWLAGLFMIGLISFLDDILTLPNKVRIAVHLISVSLLLYGLSVFTIWPILLIVSGYILVIGTINAWNFMDGINGITVLYTASVLISLFYFNVLFAFTDPNLIIIIAIATLIFGFFNCRKKAICFAGDVGAVSISFVLIYLILSLIIVTGNPIFVLLFAVYGVDSVMTIIYRLTKKENIFKAHRSHLYQLMANERKMPHLMVSSIYFVIQMLVNLILAAVIGFPLSDQWLIGGAVILLLSGMYWIVRYFLMENLRVAV